MNELIFTSDEYILFSTLCSSLFNDKQVKESGNKFIILLSDPESEKCSEKIKDMLVHEGFDINYNINNKGLLYESIIDKFHQVGW